MAAKDATTGESGMPNRKRCTTKTHLKFFLHEYNTLCVVSLKHQKLLLTSTHQEERKELWAHCPNTMEAKFVSHYTDASLSQTVWLHSVTQSLCYHFYCAGSAPLMRIVCWTSSWLHATFFPLLFKLFCVRLAPANFHCSYCFYTKGMIEFPPNTHTCVRTHTFCQNRPWKQHVAWGKQLLASSQGCKTAVVLFKCLSVTVLRAHRMSYALLCKGTSGVTDLIGPVGVCLPNISEFSNINQCVGRLGIVYYFLISPL